jgi:hypothetical protein
VDDNCTSRAKRHDRSASPSFERRPAGRRRIVERLYATAEEGGRFDFVHHEHIHLPQEPVGQDSGGRGCIQDDTAPTLMGGDGGRLHYGQWNLQLQQ